MWIPTRSRASVNHHGDMARAVAVTGKVVVITGGARGIGRATAKTLHQLGAKVAMEFAAEGLNWSASIPATNLVSEAQAGD